MTKLLRNLVGLSATLALFLGLAASSAFSQTGSLEGKVIGADGKLVNEYKPPER